MNVIIQMKLNKICSSRIIMIQESALSHERAKSMRKGILKNERRQKYRSGKFIDDF